jgi:hypothetical protein
MGPGDLDALIGEIRLEAARRRAAPDFPLDDEARLTADLDRLGPVGAGADLAAVTAALRALERHADRPVAEVAGLAASAVTALSIRLTHLERGTVMGLVGRTGTGLVGRTGAGLVGRTGTGPAGGAAHPGEAVDASAAERWADQVVVAAGPEVGRVLVAGAGAAAWVVRMVAAGRDAYGVDPAGEPYGDQGAVRSGPVYEHLRTVAAGGLGLAVLVGPLAAAEAEQLGALAAELARVTTRVAVHSEATWAWRTRLGDAAADTSPTRPVGPDAWLGALSGAGFVATAAYGPGGRDYLLSGQSAPMGRSGP